MLCDLGVLCVERLRHMRFETLDLLRCPYCGGRLELVTSSYSRKDDDEIHDGILGCHCCTFPVVAGIPVLHLLPGTVTARAPFTSRQRR